MCGDLGLELGTHKENLHLLNQLKSLFKSKARKAKQDVSKRAHIVIYPDLPSEAMIQECYDADDPPLQRATRSVGTLDCLRKSSGKTKHAGAALVPMPAPATQSPTMPSGGVASAMQQAMAQQAMGVMGMDAMAMNMMQMMAMCLLGKNQQQAQQDTGPAGLKIFAGNKTELNQVTPSRSPTAPSSAASPPAAVTPHGESQEDSQGQELQLALPDVAKLVPPEEQVAAVQAATQGRQVTRAEAKGTEPEKHTSAKAKATCKGKAKAKSKAKGAAKSPAKGSAKSMAQGAAASSKRKASDGDDAVAPSPKAKAKPSAKAKAAAEKIVFTEANRPPVPAPKSGTTWYRKGKIHRNCGAFRVFLSAGDRCDKKVKIKDEDNCEAEWQRALTMIDDSYDDIPNAD